MIAFAKLVFVAAAALSAGNDVFWPAMQRSSGPAVWMIDTPFAREGAHSLQVVCLRNEGLYLITARVGFRPLPRGTPDVNGQLRLKSAKAGELQLAPLYATAERWTAEGATHQFVVPRGGSCYDLRYDLDGHAMVNEDPRVTYIAVTYVGAIEDQN